MADPERRDVAPVTDEQRARYKEAYRAHWLACDALHAARQAWLPDHPPLPESARVDSQYTANYRVQQQILEEVRAEMMASKEDARG
jgi:uncharacterized protein VirK/YbjX